MKKYLKLIPVILFFCEKSINIMQLLFTEGLEQSLEKIHQKNYKKNTKISKRSLEVGYSILESGGSSVDAVEKTIKILEDSELFNAGKICFNQ